ncbi:unnamed protein product [Phyllotreta striolata]|uniref:SMP-30/Gluconolactonase/LRE-like region domain-containing protein n=1 Tax=Phyllotreta striolata TaxID=444603 RepID=A0A9N9TLM7_PHYSR|nr:unnamed protein product [Phyllotreta striolata]
MDPDNRSYTITPISPSIQHGEAPLWYTRRNIIYWVDTFQATIYRLLPDEQIQSYKIEGRDSVGFIIPVKHKDDLFLVFADRVVYELNWPIDQQQPLKFNQLKEIEDHKPLNQFNDGKADGKGRIWAGTLTRNSDLSVASNGGSLYLFHDNLQTCQSKIPQTSISNGLAWSKNHQKFYFIDSYTRQVREFSHNQDTGDLSDETVILDLSHHPDIEGFPDGMTIDDDDNLWIALFGGGHVIHLDTKTRRMIRKIQIPATYVTSAEFGGENLDVLYVTTSRLKLQHQRETTAGCLFTITNLGVRGRPPHESIYSD